MCNALVKSRSCEFYNNVDSNASAGASIDGVMDIEDLVKQNKKKRQCPYFRSRDLASKADIVFLPYNYLLDPTTRK